MKKFPLVRHPFDRISVSVDVIESKDNPRITHQSFKEACCLNNVVETYNRTGAIPPDPYGRVPRYGDVSLLNRPFDELLDESRQTMAQLAKFSESERERLRMDILNKRKKDREDAEAYRAAQAAVGKNNTTESQST